MNKIYKSKISPWLTLLILSAIFGPVIPMASDFIWTSLVYIIVLSVLFIPTLFNTHYILTPDQLIIKSGILFHKKIPLHSIRKIVETGNMASAPAMSLDRLEIFFGKFDTVLVSPKDKTGFIKAVTAIHPDIEVKFKNNSYGT